jgi:hypothetical protein
MGTINGERTERWKVLCEHAAKEQDSKKLSELLKEINRLPEERESRQNKGNANWLWRQRGWNFCRFGPNETGYEIQSILP